MKHARLFSSRKKKIRNLSEYSSKRNETEENSLVINKCEFRSKSRVVPFFASGQVLGILKFHAWLNPAEVRNHAQRARGITWVGFNFLLFNYERQIWLLPSTNAGVVKRLTYSNTFSEENQYFSSQPFRHCSAKSHFKKLICDLNLFSVNISLAKLCSICQLIKHYIPFSMSNQYSHTNW